MGLLLRIRDVKYCKFTEIIYLVSCWANVYLTLKPMFINTILNTDRKSMDLESANPALDFGFINNLWYIMGQSA